MKEIRNTNKEAEILETLAHVPDLKVEVFEVTSRAGRDWRIILASSIFFGVEPRDLLSKVPEIRSLNWLFGSPPRSHGSGIKCIPHEFYVASEIREMFGNKKTTKFTQYAYEDEVVIKDGPHLG